MTNFWNVFGFFSWNRHHRVNASGAVPTYTIYICPIHNMAIYRRKKNTRVCHCKQNIRSFLSRKQINKWKKINFTLGENGTFHENIYLVQWQSLPPPFFALSYAVILTLKLVYNYSDALLHILRLPLMYTRQRQSVPRWLTMSMVQKKWTRVLFRKPSKKQKHTCTQKPIYLSKGKKRFTHSCSPVGNKPSSELQLPTTGMCSS